MAAGSGHVYIPRGLSYSELQKGTEFEVDCEDGNSSDEEYFDTESANAFKEAFYNVTEDDITETLFSLNIDELKLKMDKVTDDSLVLKKTICSGAGIVIPPKSIVLVHYNAYVDDAKEPFDSTHRRGRPFKCLLGGGKIIIGLDLAISTMKKGEKAKIWIDSDYAYGPMGCPPRIPPKANIVYDVEILNFFECKEALEYEEMLPDDQLKASFVQVYAFCKTEHLMGNEYYKNNKVIAAASRYFRAIKELERVNAANEEEDLKRDTLLVKLYSNVAGCCLRQKKASRAIVNAHKALQIDENCIKALFRLGEAYSLDNDFENAKKYLLRAKRLEPCNTEIDVALAKLAERSKTYNTWNKNFCQRMLQTNSKIEKNEILSQESSKFVSVIRNKINVFQASEDKEYIFPQSSFTDSQVAVIGEIAKSCGLHFVDKIHNEQRLLKVKKKAT